MFYSYKNLPIQIDRFTTSGSRANDYNTYDCVADNLVIDINPNADFSFQIERKTPYRGVNTNGATSVISINFISQIPNDYIFLNNILLQSGQKNNFSIKCGNSTFTSGYLRSFGMSIDPHSLVKNQAEFVFFNFGSDGLTQSLPISYTGVTGVNTNSYAHGSLANIYFNDNYNEFSNHDIKKLDFTYKADITPIYNINETYPHRVVFSKEQIDLSAELDVYNLNIRNINNIIENTNIILSGLSGIRSNPTGINFQLKSGFLMSKNYNVKVNDILNSRISLKYFI